MVNDTVSDILTRIRNANLARHQIVQVPASKMTHSLIKVLKEEGFIQSYEEAGEGYKACLLVSLKYKGKKRQPVITALKRISRPGLRVYASHNDLPRVLGGLGIAIVSTSKGVMTDRRARHNNLGGEILCYVW